MHSTREKSRKKRNRQISPSKDTKTQWSFGGTATDSMIPAYDAKNDRHCKSVHSSPRKSAFGAEKTGTTRGRKGPLDIHGSSDNSQSKSELSKTQQGGVSSKSSDAGGITYHKCIGDTDPEKELDVLKAVILRENYIERIRQASEISQFTTAPQTVVDLLDLIRLSTVEVIESIEEWKRTQTKPHPFIWNGIDYLLKIPSDLDFIDKWDALIHWLGFSMQRNPFVLPGGLDGSHQPTTHIESSIQIGRRGHAHYSDSAPTNSINRSQATIENISNPYNTPIVPGMQRPSVTQRKIRRPTALLVNGSQKSTKDDIFPSHVGELDMIRVREAEKVIMSEEDIHGRYKRSVYGRLLPERLAERSANLVSLAQDEPKIAPMDAVTIEVRDEQHTSLGFRPRADGKQLAYKHGGTLAPISKLGAAGTHRSPITRSRGAKFEEEILLAKRHNVVLAEEIFSLRQSIEAMEEGSKTSNSNRSNMQKIVEEKERTLVAKELEVSRKEESMEAFKRAQKTDVNTKRVEELEQRRLRLDEGDILIDDEEAAQQIEVVAATTIQKISRGRQARRFFRRRQVQYHFSSSRIQSAARGFLARRYVCRLFHERKAAIQIQCLQRGIVAREYAKFQKLQMQQNVSAIKIQSIVRMLRGKTRVKKRRLMKKAISQLVEASHTLFPTDLLGLAETCCNATATQSPPSSILGLIQAVILLANGEDTQLAHTWGDAGRNLRRHGKLLRRLRYIASIAGKKVIRVPLLAVNLLRAYEHEPSFSSTVLGSIGLGSSAALSLFSWTQALLVLLSVQKDFIDEDFLSPLNPFVAETDEIIEADRVEDNQCATEEANNVRQFVLPELIESSLSRSRPILLVVSRDVPSHAKESIIRGLSSTLPGLFIRVNCPKLCVNELQNVFDVGHSIILDTDIGLCMAQRNAFLGSITALRASLRPSPLCLLVKGALSNRVGGRYGVSKDDLASMVDSDVKVQLEASSTAIHNLGNNSLFDQIKRLGNLDQPSPHLVHVLEAVLILLSPDKRFNEPADTSSAISWAIGRRLFQDPEALSQKLGNVDYGTIPPHNLDALMSYKKHPLWPSKSVRASNTMILWHLCEWVESVITFSQLVTLKGGMPKELSRRSPVGLFSNVVTVYDERGTESHEGECKLFKGTIGNKDRGWHQAFYKILGAALEDVRVYRKSMEVSGEHVTINVYWDCHQIFFCSYNPVTSLQHYAVVHESEINELLAPNSVELGASRETPKTKQELYNRLVQLCTFTCENAKRDKPTKSLVVCRKKIRLMREVKKVSGHYATITISELSRGDLHVDAFLHKQCKTVSMNVDANTIQELSMDSAGDEKLAYESESAVRITRYLSGRLSLFHSKKSLSIGKLESPFRLALRKRGGSGRLVLREALPHTKFGKSVISVYETDERGSLRIEVYESRRSMSRSIELSATERMYLFEGTEAFSQSWETELIRRLSLRQDNAITDDRLCLDRQIYRRYVTIPVESDSTQQILGSKPVRSFITVEALGASGSLQFRVYLSSDSSQFEIDISVAQLSRLAVQIDLSWPAPGHSEMIQLISHIMTRLRWNPHASTVVISDNSSNIRILSTPLTATSNLGIKNDGSEGSHEAEKIGTSKTGISDKMCLYKGSLRSKDDELLSVKLYRKNISNDVIVPGKPGLPDQVQTEDDIELHLVLYNPVCSSETICIIKGQNDLKEVIGPINQRLCSMKHVDELVKHIVSTRLVLSRSNPAANKNISEFRAALIRSRLYSHDKVTPIQIHGIADANTNSEALIENRHLRGLKLISKVVGLEGRTLILTVFDITERDVDIPTLRVDGYDTVSSQKCELIINTVELIEAIGSNMDLLQKAKRTALAGFVLCRIKLQHRKHDTLRIQFSRSPDLDDSEKSAAPSVTRQKQYQVYHGARLHCGLNIIVTAYYDEAAGAASMGLGSSGILLHFYEPSTSAQSQIFICKDDLFLILGVTELGNVISNSDTLRAAIEQICHVVEIKKDKTTTGDSKLLVTLTLDRDLAQRAVRSLSNVPTQLDSPLVENSPRDTPQPQQSAALPARPLNEELIAREACEISGRYCVVEYRLRKDNVLVCIVYCPSAYQASEIAIAISELSTQGYCSSVPTKTELIKLIPCLEVSLKLKNAYKLQSDDDVPLLIEWTPTNLKLVPRQN